ncbi:MAG: hypothetical protein LBQ93_06575 [Treponema sp.]|jgi:hypothetical protein|nr:hypothetical protein [Treponema sp.]
MKKIFFIIIVFTLFLGPLYQASAQSDGSSSDSLVVFDMTGFPQWARDLRRWDIVAFGSFPFSMFFVNFFYDLYRWNNANSMDFSAEGRRYAPFPFRSAGAVEKTSTEFRNSILFAAGLSVTIALADFIIVKIRRERQRRLERPPPSGSVVIERRPAGEIVPDEETKEEFFPSGETDIFDTETESFDFDESPLE